MFFRITMIKKCSLQILGFYLFRYLVNAKDYFYFMYQIFFYVYSNVSNCMKFFLDYNVIIMR